MVDNINPDHYKRLPAEAIEIIEAMIAGAPDNKAAYLHGQAAKYDLRLWRKGKSLEDFLSDLGKHIWYALRLESHLLELIEKQKADEKQKATDLQSLKDHPFGKLKEPAVKQSLNTEPPDGWRWLEVGEVIRKGDRCFTKHSGSIDCLTSVGEKFNHEAHYPTIRRNRFEVGEIVVHVNGIEPCEVVGFDREKDKYWITSNGNQYAYESKWLAPYIEETT